MKQLSVSFLVFCIISLSALAPLRSAEPTDPQFNAYLSDLFVYPFAFDDMPFGMSPGFSAAEPSYRVSGPRDTTSVTVRATLMYQGGEVDENDEAIPRPTFYIRINDENHFNQGGYWDEVAFTPNMGENLIEIRITAHAGNTMTYYIVYTRTDEPTVEGEITNRGSNWLNYYLSVRTDEGAPITGRGYELSGGDDFRYVELSPTAGVEDLRINGLLPGTEYYLQGYAENLNGTSFAEFLTFTTPPASDSSRLKARYRSLIRRTSAQAKKAKRSGKKAKAKRLKKKLKKLKKKLRTL